MNKSLIYVHDPMCSWCWGFEPVRKQLFKSLNSKVKIKRLLGGLASDSNEPMPLEMQTMLRNTWRKIEKVIPTAQFNYNFWSQCEPRRSTYPSNRAVIAARLQGAAFDEKITYLIQQAYYTEAKNPSNEAMLIDLAKKLELNIEQFTLDLQSEKVEAILQEELLCTRKLGLNTFPSIAYQVGGNVYNIELDYNDMNNMLAQIKHIDSLTHR